VAAHQNRAEGDSGVTGRVKVKNYERNKGTVKLPRENPSVEFLLEEYRNIAATHDRMRDIINRMFYYFLLLTAIPFTVASIVLHGTEFNILSIPQSLGWLFVIISASILFLSLACASARFRQNQYAKTVNGIRGYFANNDATILPYLYLPTATEKPRIAYFGHVFWYLLAMTLVGGTYACFGSFSLLSANFLTGLGAFLGYTCVLALFIWLNLRPYLRKASEQSPDLSLHPNQNSEEQ